MPKMIKYIKELRTRDLSNALSNKDQTDLRGEEL